MLKDRFLKNVALIDAHPSTYLSFITEIGVLGGCTFYKIEIIKLKIILFHVKTSENAKLIRQPNQHAPFFLNQQKSDVSPDRVLTDP